LHEHCPGATHSDSGGRSDHFTDPPAEGFLGTSVAIEGGTIVAGDCIPGLLNFVGSVYVFEEPAGGWKDATQTAS
jgi:hypothetical protein